MEQRRVPQNWAEAMEESPPTIDISRIPVKLTAVLGSTNIVLSELQQMRTGEVLTLDQSYDCYVEIRANNQPIAVGEVVLVDGNLGVRITSKKDLRD